MKQIKTIMAELNDTEEFDRDVNTALAKGWTLVKRDVLPPYESESILNPSMLYAELELVASCSNCENFDKENGPSDDCDDCNLALNKWRPREEVTP
jgi:hypothetical protein